MCNCPTKTGMLQIAEYTELTLDAVRDECKATDLVTTLANIAARPRDDDRTQDEVGQEVFDLICTSAAILAAADVYGDTDAERMMAGWLRDMARKYLFIVASQIGQQAAMMAEPEKKETMH